MAANQNISMCVCVCLCPYPQVPTVYIAASASVALAPRRDPTAPWEQIVEQLLVSGPSGAYDPVRGALVASHGDGEWAMPVAHNVLQDMADSGVIAQSTSVFGECEYTVAPPIVLVGGHL